jgi:hypothetical protein
MHQARRVPERNTAGIQGNGKNLGSVNRKSCIIFRVAPGRFSPENGAQLPYQFTPFSGT